MIMEEFSQLVQKLLGIKLSIAQVSAFQEYENQLMAWNNRINLTAINEPEKIRTKHFLDSLTCFLALPETGTDKVIDIGSGAGFPGVPLKIVQPRIQLTLVESVGKKVEFLHHIVKTLGLEQVDIVQDRIEAIGQNPKHRQQYNWALARAVAIMPVLAEYMLPLVRVGGAIIAMKGENAPAEVHTADRAIRVLGGHFRKLIPITLQGVADERYLVIIDKTAATPSGYPRRIGLPAKKPISGIS